MKKLTKKCIGCKIIKPITDFYKKQTKCKKCQSQDKNQYNHTINGVVSRIFSDQKVSCRRRNMELPKYNRHQLLEWVLKQPNLSQLFNNWKLGNYSKDLKPSIDRLNDYKTYSFDNIQLMSWKENNTKGHQDQINGINTKQCKVVLQFDLDNNFIREYYSIRETERQTEIKQTNISNCCKNKYGYKTAGGYIWKYK